MTSTEVSIGLSSCTYNTQLWYKHVHTCTDMYMCIPVYIYCALSLTVLLPFPAPEYRSWLLCYSLPVLHGLLPDPYFTHYALLVAAMHILLYDAISQSALQIDDICLHRFYVKLSDLYGELFSLCTCRYILSFEYSMLIMLERHVVISLFLKIISVFPFFLNLISLF